jgi:hypothetical protein
LKLDKHRIIQLLHKAGTLKPETMSLLNRAYDMTDAELISIADGTHPDIKDNTWFEPLGDFCRRYGIESKWLSPFE